MKKKDKKKCQGFLFTRCSPLFRKHKHSLKDNLTKHSCAILNSLNS